MKATQFEFRQRMWIALTIYVLGFWAPWLRYGKDSAVETSTWLELSGQLSRVMPLQTATVSLTLGVLFLLIAAALLRVWGTAYLGASIVQSGSMHANTVLAAGPYRHVRNPLYLGTYLSQVAIAILMPPTGALFFLIASAMQWLRLIFGEEAYLTGQQGESYLAYKARVPRLLPSYTPRASASMVAPQWKIAILAESFYVGMAVSFAALAWRYNAELLTRAVLVCFGLSLIARALFVKRAD